MTKKPQLTSHKSRFETLEDRRLLTTFNVNAPMTQEGSSTPVVINGNSYTYGGEDAYGDNATTLTATTSNFTTPSGYLNNNNGRGTVSAYLPYAYTSGPAAVWDYGDYDSGVDASNLAEYDYADQVIPSTFDSYGSNGSNGTIVSDGETILPGIAGWTDNGDNGAAAYTYGNGGLKASATPGGLTGDGSGDSVPDLTTQGGEPNMVDVPIGTLQVSPAFSPEAERFTAPTTGSYSISTTFTDAYFDPFNGPGGENGDEPWTWDDGQPDWEIIQNSYSNGATPYSSVAGTSALDNGAGDKLANSVVLASAQSSDIVAVNQAHTGSGYDDPESGPVGNSVYTDLPTPGNSISGLTTSGAALQVQYGSGIQNGSSGTGGTWTLYNAGTVAGGSGPNSGTNQKGGTDWTDDEYDLSWTVNKTVALKAGDTIDMVTWGKPDQYDYSGADSAPSYLASSISTVPTVTAAPVLTPSGSSNTFHLSGSPVAVDSGLTVASSETDLTSAQLTIGTGFQSGDMLNFSTQNGITGSYNTGTGVLSLSGSSTPGNYQTALDSVTFSTTSATIGDRTISEVAGEVPSNTAMETVHVTNVSSIAPPTVTASGSTGQTFTLGGSNVAVDSGITVTPGGDSSITGATETITNAQTGDTLHFTNQNGISGSYASGVLTLSGSSTPGNYQTALQSVTFSTTSTTKGTRTVDVVADDSNANTTTSNTAVDTVVVAISAPVVTASGSTGQTFTLGGSNVSVDSGITETSADADLTGATETITNAQTGDTLHFTNQNGISGSYAGGVLTLSGSSTPGNYQTALQSVTFSTTSTTKGTRTVDVVADDSNANTTTSNTAVDTVVVAISAPVVTANQASISSTAGQTITVDSAVTVASADANLTGATVTISSGFQSGDTFHFTAQNGITIASNTGGVLTLTGSSTPANYQTALQSVTYSSTSTSTATCAIAIVVTDSNANTTNSNTATTNILVSAPITITGAYVAGSAWTTTTFVTTSERFDSFLVSHSLGDATVPTVGYALRTGATQTTTLPFSNINTISVSFSGSVSNIGLGSLKLVGGTGGGAAAAPSVTGFTSDGSNTYSWSLSGNLGNNKYIFAIATTGTTSFGTSGTKVTDANGAGISGTFTTGSSSFPSGNGLAGSTFDFAFNVLPGDGNQNATVNSLDSAGAKALNNDHETTAGYSPYFDYLGAGIINSNDPAISTAAVNTKQSGITAPTAPSATNGGVVGTSGFTALALGVQETGSSSSSSSSTSTVSNVVPATSTSTSSTSSSTSGTSGSGSSGTSSTGTATGRHGHHEFAAVDEAVSDFDLADLYV